MKKSSDTFAILMGTLITLLLCLAAACNNAKRTSATSPAPQAQSQAPARSDVQSERRDAERQVSPEIEKQREEAEAEAKQSLDIEAIAAIAETQKAIDAIAGNDRDDALAAIEQATGKINILLARNPATALIPLSAEVDIIDIAPRDDKAAQELADDATAAVRKKDFPAARVSLYNLTSEIHVRTLNLPLATYPAALKEAARLLDQGKSDDANGVLLTVLNTLLVADRAIPLPLILAKADINEAEGESQKDKAGAQTLLQTAKAQLKRCDELGYATDNTPEYTALNADLSNLSKQLGSGEDTGSLFAQLRDKVAGLLNRQSAQEWR